MLLFIFYLLSGSCDVHENNKPEMKQVQNTAADVQEEDAAKPILLFKDSAQQINTGTTTPQQLVEYANSLTGTPYKYGSVDPAEGFDCSGFITCVFNHFSISVPRSSSGFTNIEKEIPAGQAKPGDIILL